MIFKRSSKWKPKLKHRIQCIGQYDTLYYVFMSLYSSLEIVDAVVELVFFFALSFLTVLTFHSFFHILLDLQFKIQNYLSQCMKLELNKKFSCQFNWYPLPAFLCEWSFLLSKHSKGIENPKWLLREHILGNRSGNENVIILETFLVLFCNPITQSLLTILKRRDLTCLSKIVYISNNTF